MRFGTQDGRFVLVAGRRILDVHVASGGGLPHEPVAALERWDDVRAFAASAEWSAARPLDHSRLGPPVPHPRQVLAGTPAQFSLGKSFPGFGPTGPVVVTPDELPDRDDIGFASWLDGQPLQQGRTSEMIFPVGELVAWLSGGCPLLPGDLVFTGTPGRGGDRMQPPRYLQPGQTLVSRVDGVGEIRQHFVPGKAK